MSYRCGATRITYFEDGPLPGRAWNPVEGCEPCSEGCEHCYARAYLKRCGRSPEVTLYPDRLDAPSRIKSPSVIATCFQSDLFHDDVPDSFIRAAVGRMHASPQHTFVVTTKRAERAEWVLDGLGWALANVWLGVTVENQARADERLPHLIRLAEAGWNTWVSAEPLLGPLDLMPWIGSVGWVAAGCESIGAHLGRPAAPNWFRLLRDQCAAAGVPYYLKQAAMEYECDEGARLLVLALTKRPFLDGRQHLAVPWGGDGS